MNSLPRPVPPLSSVLVSGDLVFVSGQVGRAPDGALPPDFEGQCRQVFDNLRRHLETADCSFDDVIKVNGYLASMSDFPTYNDIYVEYFSEPYPARTTVGAELLAGFVVEVDLVARKRVAADA